MDEVTEKLRVDDLVVEKEGSSLLVVVMVADSVAVEVCEFADEVVSLADEDALVMVMAAAEAEVDWDESDAEVDVATESED